MSDSTDLREYGIPALSHTGLFGVFLGVHAVSGALNVLHTGVGCKGKTQRQVVHHDLGLESHTRVGWTELSEEDLIGDAGKTFVQNARELYRRRRPSLMVVTASTAVEFTGVDLQSKVRELAQEVDCPVEFIPHAAGNGDLWTGYGSVIRTLLRLVSWDRPVAKRHTLSLVGHFFHRHEMDQAANLNECRRLLEALDIQMGPTFLGGEHVSAMMTAHRSDLLVCLPYAGMSGAELSELTGRSSLECALPMGMTATSAWLRKVATKLVLNPTRLRRLIEREEKKTAARMEIARRLLADRRIAIVADTPAAAGWTGLAMDLRMNPVLVVLLDRSLGGEQAFERLLHHSGHRLPGTTRTICNPTLEQLRLLAGPAGVSIDRLPFDIAIRPDLGLAKTGWQDAPTVETGFPSSHKHFIFPLPEFGYTGAVALAQRLMDAAAGVH